MPARALILVDFENEWTLPSSEYFVGDIKSMIERTNGVIDFCRAQGDKIIFTTHVEKDSDGAFAEGTNQVEIVSNLHKEAHDTLITKNKISPFYKTKLETELVGVEQIVVCGILTNLCVRSLVQDAYDRDFSIIVLKDCCVALDDETHVFTLKDLKETRPEVVVETSYDFLRAILV